MYTINVDWLNQNALRNYPLIDGASRVASSGAELPNALIVDLNVPVPLGSVEPGDLFVQRVYGFHAGVVITLASAKNPGVSLMTATVFIDQHELFKSYPMVGSSALEGATGRITIGSLEALAGASLSLYDFTTVPDNTRLVVSATRPLLRGIQGIRVAGQDIVSGVVTFAAGSNVSLGTASNLDGTNTLYISAQTGSATTTTTDEECGCASTQEPDLPPIRSINGVFPDANGNFSLSALDCTELRAVSNGIVINDRCTEPCCGCEQLESIRDGLQAVENTYNALQEAAEQLRSRLDNLSHGLANASLNPPSSAEASSVQWWYIPVTPNSGFVTGG